MRPATVQRELRAQPRVRLLAGLALAALAVAAQLAIFDRSAVPMDEGHLAAAASRILGGELLYRDIHTGIAPGIYHLTALLFALFGSDLVVTRWAQVAVNAGIAALLWWIAARVARPHWAALPPTLYLVLLVVGFPVLTMFNYSALALACGLASLLFLLRYLESGRVADGAALGLAIAVTALAKQNFGALVLLACLLGLLAGRRGSALEARLTTRALLPVAAAGAGLAVLTTAVVAVWGALPEMIDATVLRIGGPQLAAFDNPIPPLLGAHPDEGRFVFLYTPPALFNYLIRGEALLGHTITPALRGASIRLSYGLPLLALFVSPLLLWWHRARGSPGERSAARAVVLFAWLFALGIFPSAVWSHLCFVLPPILLLFALLGDGAETALAGRSRRLSRGFTGAVAALVAVSALVALRIGADVQRWYPHALGLPRGHLYVSDEQAALYRGALRFVERCAGADDAIFVAPDLPILYFLSGRRNPTRYDLTIPGDVDGRLIIERLEADETPCVVYNPRMYPEFPPFERLFPELARYLDRAYRRDAVIRAGGSQWQGLVRVQRGTP